MKQFIYIMFSTIIVEYVLTQLIVIGVCSISGMSINLWIAILILCYVFSTSAVLFVRIRCLKPKCRRFLDILKYMLLYLVMDVVFIAIFRMINGQYFDVTGLFQFLLMLTIPIKSVLFTVMLGFGYRKNLKGN